MEDGALCAAGRSELSPGAEAQEGLTRRGPCSAEQRDFSNTEVLNIGINTSLEGCPVPSCFVRFVN